MITSKRVVNEKESRYGGYASVRNTGERAPRVTFHEEEKYERQSGALPYVASTEAQYAPTSYNNYRYTDIPKNDSRFAEFRQLDVEYPEYEPTYDDGYQARTRSEAELMPTIRTMRTLEKQEKKSLKPEERTVGRRVSRSAGKAEGKSLSATGKLMIAVYAIIVFITVALIIASSVAANNRSADAARLAAQSAAGQERVAAGQTEIIYLTDLKSDNPQLSDYEDIDEGSIKKFELIPLSSAYTYEEENTNWFDKLGDWISRVFGG